MYRNTFRQKTTKSRAYFTHCTIYKSNSSLRSLYIFDVTCTLSWSLIGGPSLPLQINGLSRYTYESVFIFWPNQQQYTHIDSFLVLNSLMLGVFKPCIALTNQSVINLQSTELLTNHVSHVLHSKFFNPLSSNSNQSSGASGFPSNGSATYFNPSIHSHIFSITAKICLLFTSG